MKLKISRLFHWLYATLMFLPILMFIPSCLYYGFNEHATNETTTTINYKYQSNEVNTIADIHVGNIYELDSLDLTPNTNYTFSLILYKFTTVNFEYDINSVVDEVFLDLYQNNNFNDLYVAVSPNQIDLRFTNDNCYVYLIGESSLSLENVVFSLDDNLNDFNNLLQDQNVFPTYTDYNVIESVDTNVQDTISNKMYQAWEGVWDLPLFQWTQNSFITAPFSYITGLFGLSSDNSLNCVFTYFASISICWLVFDLIMYVPNLAHRWLDRSAIE